MLQMVSKAINEIPIGIDDLLELGSLGADNDKLVAFTKRHMNLLQHGSAVRSNRTVSINLADAYADK